jgi:cellulose synthase/poly-beta-1,6-N-acetylglucosamine synthase-like glycosyltransferase
LAGTAGALVLSERRRGKGNAVRRAFAAIEADIYVVADGDGTYDAAQAPSLISKLVEERLDMVVAKRQTDDRNVYRRDYELGNRLFNRVLKSSFGSTFVDTFSGYRVLSRRFVNSTLRFRMDSRSRRK